MQFIPIRGLMPVQWPTSVPTGSSPVLVSVADVMMPTHTIVSPSADLYAVIGMMQRQRVPCLVVEPLLPIGAWGIVTLREAQAALAANQREARDAMTTPPFVVVPNMRIEDCSALMLATGQRRIVVVQANRPVGIITDSELFQAIEARG